MRALLPLLVLAVVVAATVWLYQRYRAAGSVAIDPRGGQSGSAAVAAAPFGRDEQVAMVFGPEAGPGRLRLSPTQLVFTAGSGRVAVLERVAITGVGATTELPDRHIAKPVLVVTTLAEEWYLAVARPEEWLRELS